MKRAVCTTAILLLVCLISAVFSLPTQADDDSTEPFMKLSAANGAYSVTITSDAPRTGSLIFAAYDAFGRLFGIDMKSDMNIDAGSNTYSPSAAFRTDGAQRIAVMLWDNLINMLPLCGSKQVAYYYFSDFAAAVDAVNSDSIASGSATRRGDSVCFAYEDTANDRAVISLLSDIALSEGVHIGTATEIIFSGKFITYNPLTKIGDVSKSAGGYNLFFSDADLYLNAKDGGGAAVLTSNLPENADGHLSAVYTNSPMAILKIDGGSYSLTGNTGNLLMRFLWINDGRLEMDNAQVSIASVTTKNLSGHYCIELYGHEGTDSILSNSTITMVNRVSPDAGNFSFGGIALRTGRSFYSNNNTISVDLPNNSAGYPCGMAIFATENLGTLYINGGEYRGTHSGVSISSNSYIEDGTFTSCSHGGVYLGGNNTVHHIKNSTVGCKEYDGEFDFSAMATGYLSAFYIGDLSHPTTVYMDNCTILGLGNTGGAMHGNGNALYISNTDIPAGKLLRIDSGNRAIAGEGTNITASNVTDASRLTFTDSNYAYES